MQIINISSWYQSSIASFLFIGIMIFFSPPTLQSTTSLTSNPQILQQFWYFFYFFLCYCLVSFLLLDVLFPGPSLSLYDKSQNHSTTMSPTFWLVTLQIWCVTLSRSSHKASQLLSTSLSCHLSQIIHLWTYNNLMVLSVSISTSPRLSFGPSSAHSKVTNLQHLLGVQSSSMRQTIHNHLSIPLLDEYQVPPSLLYALWRGKDID